MQPREQGYRRLLQAFPSCLRVGCDNGSHGVFATHFITKGEIVDTVTDHWIVPNDDSIYELHNTNDEEDRAVYLVHSYTNTLLYTPHDRVCNGYIGFINHSCSDANVHFRSLSDFTFQVIASRDIQEKEELTSNYFLFDYTSDGHKFNCTCHGSKCYRKINGFKSLNFIDQVTLLDQVTDTVLHAFIRDNHTSLEREYLLNRYAIDDYLTSFAFPFDNINVYDTVTSSITEIIEDNALFEASFILLFDKIKGSRGLYRSGEKVIMNTNTDIHSESEILLDDLRSSSQGIKTIHPRVVKYVLNVDKNKNYSHQISFRCEESKTIEGIFVDLTVHHSQILVWRYNTDIYDPKMFGKIVESYELILKQLSRDFCQYSLSSLSLVGEEEKFQLINTFNNTQINDKGECHGNDIDARHYIHLLIEKSSLYKDRVALECGNQRVTYNQLLERVHIQSCILQSRYLVKPNDVVGIMIPRCFGCDMVIALLSVMKAGAAYTALMPDFATRRLEYIVSKSSVILTHTTMAHKFQSWFKGEIVCIDNVHIHSDVNDDDGGSSALKWNDVLSLSSLAYVTYTSGSTGEPKAILVQHAQFTRYAQQQPYVDIEIPNNRVLHSTNITFDIICLELYMPLLRGLTVVVVENLLSSNLPLDVGFIQGPSSLLERTFYCRSKMPQLVVSQIGERLSTRVMQKFATVYNGYGTAETVNISVTEKITMDVDGNVNTNVVGNPTPGSYIYVLSALDQSLLPLGVPGEVCIGGLCVAQLGYRQLPQLNTSKFLRDPFSTENMDTSPLLYRTGDIGRWTEDGKLVLLGRLDNQVKINGVRIELEEIESTAASYSSVVTNTICFYAEGRDQNKMKLYLFYTIGDAGDGDGDDIEENIRRHLTSHLPPSMVPAVFIRIDTLPINPNGKIDRQKLRRDIHLYNQDDGRENKGLWIPTLKEQKILDIWIEALDMKQGDDVSPHIGGDDKFFHVGGDSIRLIQMLYILKREYAEGVTSLLRIADIYEHDSIRKLAAYMEKLEIEAKKTLHSSPSSYTTTYYQMNQVLYFKIQASYRVQLRHDCPVSGTEICYALLEKYPILSSRVIFPSPQQLERDRDVTDLRELRPYPLQPIPSTQYKFRHKHTATSDDILTIDVSSCVSDISIDNEKQTFTITMSHIIFDGYSLICMFGFIDNMIETSGRNLEIRSSSSSSSSSSGRSDCYCTTNSEINANIENTYDDDLQFWKDYFSEVITAYSPSVKKVNTRLEDSIFPTISSQDLKGLSTFEMIKVINDASQFPCIFHIETSTLRKDTLSFFENGCLLFLKDKYVSVSQIEKHFYNNLHHATIPIYLLINRFSLVNMVYINNAMMEYVSYANFDVVSLGMEEDDECPKGHYVLCVIRFKDDIGVRVGENSNHYYVLN